MTHRHPARRHRGFTLVELLVVIGIIALLISILLPSLSNARKSAQSIKCLSNLRQIMLGVTGYSADMKGYLPRGLVNSATLTQEQKTNWALLISTYIIKSGTTFDDNDKTSAVFQCPSASVKAGSQHYVGSHGLFGWDNDPVPFDRPLKISSQRRSTEMAVVWDSAQIVDAANPRYGTVGATLGSRVDAFRAAETFSLTARYNTPDDPADFLPPTYSPNRDGPTSYGDFRFRHGAKENLVNIGFLDGHAESRRAGDIRRRDVLPDAP